MGAVASCFVQILALIDRSDFARAVRQHAAARAAKGLSCWEQCVAMLFCQLGSVHSLREVCGGLATALGKLVHLGVRRTPARSTLAYANAHRPWQLYETLFYQVLTRCQAVSTTTVSLFDPRRNNLPVRWKPLGTGLLLRPDVPTCEKCIGDICPFWDCFDRVTVDHAAAGSSMAPTPAIGATNAGDGGVETGHF